MTLGRLLLLAAAALPLAALLTLALLPAWRALEARTGIEAVGHSGPAGWCYVATWALLLALGAAGLALGAASRTRPAA